MLSPQLLDELKRLSLVDKRHLVQRLVGQINDEELLLTNQEYENWSPYDSASAAVILNDILIKHPQIHE